MSTSLLTLATAGVDGYVYALLTRHLGRWVDVSRDQISVSAWHGEGVLEHVAVRPDALRSLEMPLRVVRGTAAQIRLIVPWHALRTEPVTIRVEGLALAVVAEAARGVQLRVAGFNFRRALRTVQAEVTNSYQAKLVPMVHLPRPESDIR